MKSRLVLIVLTGLAFTLFSQEEYVYRGKPIKEKVYLAVKKAFQSYIYRDQKGNFYNLMEVDYDCEGKKIVPYLDPQSKVGNMGKFNGKIIGVYNDAVIISWQKTRTSAISASYGLTARGGGGGQTVTVPITQTITGYCMLPKDKTTANLVEDTFYEGVVKITGNYNCAFGNIPKLDSLIQVSDEEFKEYLNKDGILYYVNKEPKYVDCEKCQGKGDVKNPEYTTKKMVPLYLICNQCKGKKQKKVFTYSKRELK